VWACSAHTDHIIDLQLESRIFRSGVPDEAAEERVLFSIAFLDGKLLNRWHCLEVYVLTGDPQPTQRPSAKVNFATSTTTPFDPSTLPTIHCLCKTMSIPQGQANHALCLDHKQRLLGGYPITSPIIHRQQERNGSSTSLDEILTGSSASTRARPFSSKQAYLLGLTVASSFLQLRATPWLCGSWRAKNVLFINETTAKSIDFDKPYIRQTYSSCPQQPTVPQALTIDDDADDNCSFLNRNLLPRAHQFTAIASRLRTKSKFLRSPNSQTMGATRQGRNAHRLL
jgi:hypothetical protein